MPQNVEKKQLLVFDSDCDSYFKIVGYELRMGDKVYHKDSPFLSGEKIESESIAESGYFIKHDGFNIHSSAGEKDWYEDDLVIDIRGKSGERRKGTIVNVCGALMILWTPVDEKNIQADDIPEYEPIGACYDFVRKIGSIHKGMGKK